MSEIDQLYRNYHSWLQRLLISKLEQKSDAEDVSQDTFIRVLSRKSREPIQDPQGYLWTVAKGLTIDLYRRRSLERHYLECLASIPEAEHPSAEAHHLILESILEIDAMLDGLGGKVKAVFVLSQIEGRTYPDIANQLEISRRTVVNYMAKAMQHCCIYRLEHGL